MAYGKRKSKKRKAPRRSYSTGGRGGRRTRSANRASTKRVSRARRKSSRRSSQTITLVVRNEGPQSVPIVQAQKSQPKRRARF